MSKKNKQNVRQLSSHSATPASKTAAASPSPSRPNSLPSASVGSRSMQPKTAPLPAHMADVPRLRSSPPTLEQQRAAHALTIVREIEAAPFAKEYRSYVESLPATIVMNGLGQACATLLAATSGDGNRGHAYHALHQHLQSWLCRPAVPGQIGGVYPGPASLIDAIVNHGQAEYVHAQAEALAYLVWLKKFAQAFLPRGEGSRNE